MNHIHPTSCFWFDLIWFLNILGVACIINLFIYLFIYLFTYLLTYLLMASPHGMQDPSSPTRDWACIPTMEAQSPNHWTNLKSSPPVFVNKVLLEHSYSPAFIYCLCCFPTTAVVLSGCNSHIWASRKKGVCNGDQDSAEFLGQLGTWEEKPGGPMQCLRGWPSPR